MIIRNRGLVPARSVSRRPKSSIPQRENSIHLDLQVLYSKKNMLESNIRLWETKINAIAYELKRVEEAIAELEIHTNKALYSSPPHLRGSSSDDPLESTGDSNVKLVDLEY